MVELTLMYFLFEDDDLWTKYNDIWKKVSSSMKKELDCEPMYKKKCLQTKIKSYNADATDFRDKEILKVGSICTCLADENYFQEVFLKEFKYIEKEKVIRDITDDLKFSSDESDEE